VGYTNTFIACSEDCPVTTGEVPLDRSSGPTVASTQYAMLVDAPGHWTQEDVLFASSPDVRGRSDLRTDDLERLREVHFAQPRECLRASPLPKSFGWGLHFDSEGRITLHAVDSPGYARLRSDSSIHQLRSMRSRRSRG